MKFFHFLGYIEYDKDDVLFSGLPEECKVQTPAFTDAVRLYRQAHGHYGTWDMMCGTPPQVKRTCARLQDHFCCRTVLNLFSLEIFEFIKGVVHFKKKKLLLIIYHPHVILLSIRKENILGFFSI